MPLNRYSQKIFRRLDSGIRFDSIVDGRRTSLVLVLIIKYRHKLYTISNISAFKVISGVIIISRVLG